MNFTRTPIGATLPLSIADSKDYLRVTDFGEDYLIGTLISAVASEIEAQTDIALLSQTITATTADAPEQTIALPVGPVTQGESVTVASVASDGTVTAIPSGWWLEAGRYPVLHFTGTAPVDRVRITYAAGYATLPADLGMAIADQVARLYDNRGGVIDKAPALSAHTARVIARYRRVAL